METTGAAGTRPSPANTSRSSTRTARRSSSRPRAKPSAPLARPRTCTGAATGVTRRSAWRPSASTRAAGTPPQDLADSTMQNYKRHIEEHLLPDFEDKALSGVLRTDVELWEKKERAVYAASSVKTWRSTLHLVFEDAIDEGLITSNPAARRRGRGKRAGRSRDRPGEGRHRCTRHPACRRACRPAVRSRRRVRRRGPQGLHGQALG